MQELQKPGNRLSWVVFKAVLKFKKNLKNRNLQKDSLAVIDNPPHTPGIKETDKQKY